MTNLSSLVYDGSASLPLDCLPHLQKLSLLLPLQPLVISPGALLTSLHVLSLDILEVRHPCPGPQCLIILNNVVLRRRGERSQSQLRVVQFLSAMLVLDVSGFDLISC
jgi:hypothetical protein